MYVCVYVYVYYVYVCMYVCRGVGTGLAGRGWTTFFKIKQNFNFAKSK